MRRHLLALAALALPGGSALAQGGYTPPRVGGGFGGVGAGFGGTAAPGGGASAVSPYLLLGRGGAAGGASPGLTYYGLVRPVQDFRSSISNLQGQLAGTQGELSGLETGLNASAGAATGTRLRFLNTGGYFLNMQGGTSTGGGVGFALPTLHGGGHPRQRRRGGRRRGRGGRRDAAPLTDFFRSTDGDGDMLRRIACGAALLTPAFGSAQGQGPVLAPPSLPSGQGPILLPPPAQEAAVPAPAPAAPPFGYHPTKWRPFPGTEAAEPLRLPNAVERPRGTPILPDASMKPLLADPPAKPDEAKDAPPAVPPSLAAAEAGPEVGGPKPPATLGDPVAAGTVVRFSAVPAASTVVPASREEPIEFKPVAKR